MSRTNFLYCIPLTLLLGTASPASAKGVGLLDMEGCTYNGKRLDKSIAKKSATAIPKVKPSFSGRIVCYNIGSGTRFREIEVRKGKEHGWSRTYLESTGRVTEEVHYKNGVRHGMLRRFRDKDRYPSLEWSYADGKIHGVQKDFYTKTGQLKSVSWMATPRSRDTTLRFNKDGTLASIVCGKVSIDTRDHAWCGRNGKESEVLLYSNGKKKPIKIQRYKNGVKSGKQVSATRTGSVVDFYKDGAKIRSERFKDGKLLVAREFTKGGKKKGDEVIYFPGTKQKSIVVEWANSKKIQKTSYYQNGKKKEVVRYRGKASASIVRYYDSGKKSREGNYEQMGSRWWSYWRPHGIVKQYSDFGNSEYSYKYGTLDGTSKEFYENGKVQSIEEYKDGNLTSVKNFDDTTGKLILHATFLEDGSVKKTFVGKLKN